MTGRLPDRVDVTAGRVDPVRRVAAALSNASSAVRQGREPVLDLDELRGCVDAVIAELLRSQRGELIRTVGIRASGLAGDLARLYSGETVDPLAIVGGLQALQGGIGMIEQLLEGSERRPAA